MSHPTGATDVILRMEQGGGFVPMEYFVTQAPQFTLYGDGRIVFQRAPSASLYGALMPPFLTGTMSENKIAGLLTFALDTARLRNAHEQYPDPRIADGDTTTFTVDADGISKTVSIYALAASDDSRPDAGDRAAFQKLADRLRGFDSEAANGALDDLGNYDPAQYRVVLYEQSQGEPTVHPQDWPWSDLTPVDFEVDANGWHALALMRAQVARLTSVPNGGQRGIWVTTPEGALVTFTLRPLLPDEMAAID